MELYSIPKEKAVRSRWVLFFALSRTPHALLDMAAPGLAGLLLLDAFPPLKITLLGLFTVFSGYTSVYALNDLIDCRSDRIKIAEARSGGWESYLDSAIIRHPLARGLLKLGEGVSWAAAWGFLAFMGAYLLNPICAFIFIAGCVLEAIYCLLWRVSHLRAIITGAVKSSGPVAAVFALDPSPPPVLLVILFLWFYAWEIGGQNIPADWAEVEDDRHLDGRTIPVRLGPRTTGVLTVALLSCAILLSLALVWVAPLHQKPICAIFFTAAGVLLLLVPAVRLCRSGDPLAAMTLFNRSSFYPLVLLVGVGIKVLFS